MRRGNDHDHHETGTTTMFDTITTSEVIDRSAPRRGPRPGRALRMATVLQVLASAGGGLAYVALSLRMYQETHSTLAVTMVLVAGGLPVLLLAPVAGLLLDRLHMGRLLAVASLAVAAALVVLAFERSLTATVLLVLCFGVADSVLQPGITAAIPQLAGEVSVVRATSRLQGAAMGGTAVGPLLAGVIGSLGGVKSALLLDAGISVAFAAGVLLLGLHKVDRSGHAGKDDGIGAGIRYLRRDRPMGLLILVVTFMFAFMGMTLVAELFLAEKVLHGGTTGFALLVTAWTGGMTLGTMIAGRLKPHAVAPAIVIGLAVMGLGVVAGALSPTMWLAIVAYGIGGIGDGIQMVGARTLLLERSPAHIAGRTMAILTGLTMGAISLGTAIASPVVALLGIRGAVFAAGMASVVASVLAVVLRLYRLQGRASAGAESEPPLASGAPALI